MTEHNEEPGDRAAPPDETAETKPAAQPVEIELPPRPEDGESAPEPDQLMTILDSDISPAIESVLLVLDQPTPPMDIARAIGIGEDLVVERLRELQDEYDQQGRGFQLREAAGGWRLYTREQYAPAVERFVLDGQKTRLTQAALETLAVIAYRQPVTRARVSAIRGVTVDGVVRTLLTRELIEESGQEEGSGGGLLSTTDLFLEKLGLKSITDLPPIAPLLPDVDPEMDERLESGLAAIADMEMD
jgi:segregation and condensation protein B